MEKNINEKYQLENTMFSESDSFCQKENNTISNIFTREKYFAYKKNLKLNKIKDSLFSNEQLNIKFTPGIDAGSKKIISKKLKHNKPIYERYLETQRKKKEKIDCHKKDLMQTNSTKIISLANYNSFDNLSDNLQKTHDSNQNTFKENHNNYIQNTKHFNDWLISNEKWIFKKERKFQELKKKLEEEQLDYENSTFTPNIDKISDYLANIKSLNEFPGLEVYDKLYIYKDLKKIKQRKLIEKATPSFTPLTNKSFPKYFLAYKKNQKLNQKSNIYEKGKAEIELLLKQSFTKKDSSKIKKDLSELKNNSKYKYDHDLKNKAYISGSFFVKENIKNRVVQKCDLTFFEENVDNKYIFYK